MIHVPAKISFYVIAHADDWQLFMQPNGYKDLTVAACKVVFIITTAGDAGMDDVYWSAREEGFKSSIRFCLAPIGTLAQANGIKNINDHIITYWSISNATCYFLRLPDGNLDGSGFEAQGHQSLAKLKEGYKLTAVDNSTIYQSWPDFSATLEAIILYEKKELTNATIGYLNPDKNNNPDDHADHLATGEAIQAMAVINRLEQVIYTGYSTCNARAKLQHADLFWKAGMFAAYEKAVYDQSGYSTLQESIQTYVNWNLSDAQFIIVKPQSIETK